MRLNLRGFGLGAVDLVKRCDDLRRFAAPTSGASANERAMALRELARLGCGTVRPPNDDDQDRAAQWSRAAQSTYARSSNREPAPPWQTDKRGSSAIYREDFGDLNYAKKAIYEHAKPPRLQVWLIGFDGSFGRNSFSAYSSLDDLDFAGKVLEQWDAKGGNRYTRNGVYEAVLAQFRGRIKIVRIRGKGVSKHNLWLDGGEGNPFNDSGFARRVNQAIEEWSSR